MQRQMHSGGKSGWLLGHGGKFLAFITFFHCLYSIQPECWPPISCF